MNQRIDDDAEIVDHRRDATCAVCTCSRHSLNESRRIPIYWVNPISDRRFGRATLRSYLPPAGSIDMMSKRVGKWAWALSGEERVAAAIVGVAQSEKSEISAKLKKKYDAMLEKQRKLTAS